MYVSDGIAYAARRLPAWMTSPARTLRPAHHNGKIRWTDAKHFTINGVRFFATVDPSEYAGRQADVIADELLIIKTKGMIDKITSISVERAPKIFEMGIWRGGSVVFYDQFLRPSKLVATEWDAHPVLALDAYLAEKQRHAIVKPYYGVNQGDPQRMGEILSSEFPDRDISLVIDDASHFYAETKQAFNCVFPYVAAGGSYVIKDWGWAHSGQTWKLDYFKDKSALTNLLVELCMLSTARPDIVASIEVHPSMFIVKKGTAVVPLIDWNIDREYTARGVPFNPVI